MERAHLLRQCEESGCGVREHEMLAAHTTFRIGGAADAWITATTAAQAAHVLQLCHCTGTPLLVVGNGSNLLVRDEGFAGVVLHPLADGTSVAVNGTVITAPAGVSLGRLCAVACEAGLAGLEFAYGIPGTVGGGTYMNAGAYGGQLSDVIVSVTALTPQGKAVELGTSELAMGYRHSVFMEENLTVWSVAMKLQAGEPSAIRANMEEYMARRREKQPLEYPSAGSFFKRPAGHFAGALIEQCGLKGLSVGDAQVSEKHAGFLINRGQATCAEVLALCRQVQDCVKERFGVQLEREVQLV